MTKLTRTQSNRAKRRYENVHDSITALASITVEDHELIVYRESITSRSDGFPTSTRPRSGSRGSDPMTPTEASALPAYTQRDTQSTVIAEFLRDMREVRRLTERMSKVANFLKVTAKDDEEFGPRTQICEICEGTIYLTAHVVWEVDEDGVERPKDEPKQRVVSGMGPVCWERYKHQRKMAAKRGEPFDKGRWTHDRRNEIESGHKHPCGVKATIPGRRMISADPTASGGYVVDDLDALVRSGTLPRGKNQ